MQLDTKLDRRHKNPSSKSDYPYALSHVMFDTDQLFVSSELVEPGKKSSAPHYHHKVDEVIFILSGELNATEGSKSVLLKKGDSVCFHHNSGKLHYLENKSEFDAEFLILRRKSAPGDIVYK